jgi:hypothetical protein
MTGGQAISAQLPVSDTSESRETQVTLYRDLLQLAAKYLKPGNELLQTEEQQVQAVTLIAEKDERRKEHAILNWAVHLECMTNANAKSYI